MVGGQENGVRESGCKNRRWIMQFDKMDKFFIVTVSIVVAVTLFVMVYMSTLVQ